jgi:hypothetical protein
MLAAVHGWYWPSTLWSASSKYCAVKKNDEKVQEAIKRTDTEAKAKQDKVRDVLH